MTDELPPLWALDMAAKAAGYADWADAKGITIATRNSIIAHARTIAKYETPPVDPAELKRWQDARMIAAQTFAADEADDFTDGHCDHFSEVRAAYRMACHRDGVEPQDKAPGA